MLIVPYGIETCIYVILIKKLIVLIVPYGIETSYGKPLGSGTQVLIVPYGIETLGLLAIIS